DHLANLRVGKNRGIKAGRLFRLVIEPQEGRDFLDRHGFFLLHSKTSSVREANRLRCGGPAAYCKLSSGVEEVGFQVGAKAKRLRSPPIASSIGFQKVQVFMKHNAESESMISRRYSSSG